MKITTQIKNSTSLHSVAGVIALAALSASGAVAQDAALGIPDEGYSLEALVAAAKQEGPITVVDATGKIVTMAENFAEKYGIETTGVNCPVRIRSRFWRGKRPRTMFSTTCST